MTKFNLLKKFLLLSPIYKYKISGTSMGPTIKVGQTVLVNRLSYWFTKPKIDDIIALYDPRDGKILIKRITKKNRTKYFVEGDNKGASTDSRVFGWIEKRAIIGKVVI
jgi:nickel-type superoxide dismutase maturation protease